MTNKKNIVTMAFVLVSSAVSADIYDDYKLLAEAITINSEKIKKLDNKNSIEISKILGKLQGENEKLKQKIQNIEVKISENKCVGKVDSSVPHNQDFLQKEQRDKLLRMVNEGALIRENK